MSTKTASLSRAEVNEAFTELRREIVTGDETVLVDYVTELAAVAANAHRANGTFRRWSHRNHLLITAQRTRLGESHVGLYAGRAQWSRLGRSVRDDVTPKVIWAASGSRKPSDDEVQTPIVGTEAAAEAVKAVSEKLSPTPNSDPEPAKWVSRFRAVEVFDWSDTVAVDPDVIEPDWAAPVLGEGTLALDALTASSPVPVAFEPFGGRVAHGETDGKSIAVDSSLSAAAQAVELARQIAHVKLGTPADFPDCVNDPSASPERTERECTATLVAVLVASMLDIDAGDATRSAANWLRTFVDPDTGQPVPGHKRRLKMLNTRLDAAMDVANGIIAAATAQ